MVSFPDLIENLLTNAAVAGEQSKVTNDYDDGDYDDDADDDDADDVDNVVHCGEKW